MSVLAPKNQYQMTEGMERFFASALRHRILSRKEVYDLIGRVREGGQKGKRAKDKLVKHNLRLVQKQVYQQKQRHHLQHLKEEDLFQEGVAGLCTAIDKFDTSKGVEFSTYAHYWIYQRIRRAIHDQDRTIRLPVHKIEVGVRVWNATIELERELGREPTKEEVAERYNKKYPTAKDMARPASFEAIPQHTLSLDVPVGFGDDNARDRGHNLLDIMPSPEEAPDEETAKEEAVKELRSLFGILTERDRDIMRRRYGFEPYKEVQTLRDIAKVHGITQERVRQVEMSSLATLKAFVNPESQDQQRLFPPAWWEARKFSPEALRGIVQTKGLTKKGVAKRCGLTELTVQALLEGGRNPQPATIKALVEGLGIEYEDILVLRANLQDKG